MTKMLSRVGVPDKVLKLIPEICQTCKVCREWQKPGPTNASNIEIADSFNVQVEADLLFIHKHIIFHFIDRCTRWHAAVLIPDKTDDSLVKGFETCWASIHGPPKEFITDGETGIVISDYFQAFLKRKGIKPVTPAKDSTPASSSGGAP